MWHVLVEDTFRHRRIHGHPYMEIDVKDTSRQFTEEELLVSNLDNIHHHC